MKKFYSIIIPIFSFLVMSSLVSAQTVTIRVGSKDYTEQIVVSELTAQYLEEKGFKVLLERGLNPNFGLRKTLIAGDVDLYWELLGTAYTSLGKEYRGETTEIIYDRVKKSDSKIGLTWLNNSDVLDTYGFGIKEEFARKNNINSMEDLVAYQGKVGGLRFASDSTFHSRPDGLVLVEKKYGFKFEREEIHRTEVGLIYDLLNKNEVDVGLVYTTDGRTLSNGLRVFDFGNVFPPYVLVPVIRQDILSKYPGLSGYLNDISAALNTEEMTKLNSRVDVDNVYIWEVAEDFLVSKGLLGL